MESLQEGSALPPPWVIVTKQHLSTFLCYSCSTARKETHFVCIWSYLMDPCYVKRLWACCNFQSYFTCFLDNVFFCSPIFHNLWLCDLGHCSQFDLKKRWLKQDKWSCHKGLTSEVKLLSDIYYSFTKHTFGGNFLTHRSKHKEISTLGIRTTDDMFYLKCCDNYISVKIMSFIFTHRHFHVKLYHLL